MTLAATTKGAHSRTIPRNDLIFDIGMHSCEDTDFYLAKGFRVVAVDANPLMCKAAVERYADEISDGRFTVVNRAISETRSPLTFYVCKTNTAWSTASPRLRDFWRASEGAEFVEIETESVTTGDLVSEYGVPYYAKIDIEGFDLTCLRGFSSCGARPTYVSMEVDFRYVDRIVDCATGLGYRRFSLVGQRTACRQRQPRPAREGREVEYTFHEGASGLFGRELPTEWVDARMVRAKCRAVIRQYRASGLARRCIGLFPKKSVESFQTRFLPLACDWYDVHAALEAPPV
jgi:FkbM family methyltransferase